MAKGFKLGEIVSSDRKRSSTNKRNRPKMEQRYNSNKVLEYKRTPTRSKKRTLNGSTNHSFVSNKRASKTNLRDREMLYTKEQFYSERRNKPKRADKRSASNGLRKGKELYFVEETKGSPIGSSSKKDNSNCNNYEEMSNKSSKQKPHPYSSAMGNYYFRQPEGGDVRSLKQKNIARKHVDHKAPSNSFNYNMQKSMFSPSSSGRQTNQSAVGGHGSLSGHQLQKSRRVNCLKSGSNKSRDQGHYRINSSSKTKG